MFDNSLSMDPVLTSLFNAMTTSLIVGEEGGGGAIVRGCRALGVAPAHCSCLLCLLRNLADVGKRQQHCSLCCTQCVMVTMQHTVNTCRSASGCTY